MSASVHRRGEWKAGRKWPSPWNVASGVLLALSFFQYLYSPLKWVALGSVGVGIPPLIIRSIAALKSLVLDINILMLIAGTLYEYHSPNVNRLFLDNFVIRGIYRLWVLFSIWRFIDWHHTFISILAPHCVEQCPGRILGIIGQNHSVSKSNRLHVVIFRVFFINLRCVP